MPVERARRGVGAGLGGDAGRAGAERGDGEGAQAELFGEEEGALGGAGDARSLFPRAHRVEHLAAAEGAGRGGDALAEGALSTAHGLVFDDLPASGAERAADAGLHFHLVVGAADDAIDLGVGDVAELAAHAERADLQLAPAPGDAGEARAQAAPERAEEAHRRAHRGHAPRRIAIEHPREHVLEIGFFCRVGRGKLQLGPEDDVVELGERGRAVEEIVGRGAERVDVALAVGHVAAQDLGGDEAQRAAGDLVAEAPGHGDAEIPQADAGLRGEEEVRRLDVAVEDARLMRALERVGDGVDDLAHEPEREPAAERRAAALIELGEVEPVDVLLRQVGAAFVEADVDGADDARARDPRHEAGLVAQAREGRGAVAAVEQRLEDDGRRELLVAREPDAAHPALTDRAPDLEDAALGAGEIHRRARHCRAPNGGKT